MEVFRPSELSPRPIVALMSPKGRNSVLGQVVSAPTQQKIGFASRVVTRWASGLCIFLQRGDCLTKGSVDLRDQCTDCFTPCGTGDIAVSQEVADNDRFVLVHGDADCSVVHDIDGWAG